MKVNRKELLNELEAVLPGLSVKEEVEQSACVVFQNKMLYTYNDEISCSVKTSVNFNAAVQALPLVRTLRKMTDKNVTLKAEEGQLCVHGKKRKIHITLSSDITLNIDAVDEPKKWKKLPKDFNDAMNMVSHCCGRDETRFALTCIHITPEYVEAMDNQQGCRYTITNKFKKELLIRREVASHLNNSRMVSFSETKGWMHFKNKDGLILSCRRYLEDYPNLEDILNFKGKKVVLPEVGVDTSVEIAEIFSSDADDDNKIAVKLSKNKLEIIGDGMYGDATAEEDVVYKGRDLNFRISPKLFISIILKKNKAMISKSRIKIRMGDFVYVAALGAEKAEE